MMKRREFLAAGSSLIATAGLAPRGLMAAPSSQLDIREIEFSSGLRKTKFDALLRQTFYIHGERAGTVSVRLVQVTGTDQPTNPEQFSLFFRGPGLPSLHAGTYTVEHYLAGRTAMYLEPVPTSTHDLLYRADFCLLH
jgi:hypothetical protein